MDILAGLLFLAAAGGCAALGAKYALGDVPLDYHRKMLEARGASVTPEITHVLTAMYGVAGSAAIGLAIVTAGLAILGTMMGSALSSLVICAAGLTALVQPVRIGKLVEEATGVRTPWRAGAGLGAVLILGLIASLL